MTRLPSKDEITLRWLVDHIPVGWWVGIFVALAAVFSAGVGAGRMSFQKLDGDIASKIALRDQLQSDVQKLSAQKAQLHVEVISLQVQEQVQKMTPAQVREALKPWTHD